MSQTKPLQSGEYQLLIRRLKAARLEAGLTQVEAAKRLDQAQSYVAKVERLYRRLDVLEAWEMLRIYDMAADDLFAAPSREEQRWMAAALRAVRRR